MIFTITGGKTYNTETELTSPERHVLQKLFLWETMASSIQEFQQKKADALAAGWNNSGPVSEEGVLKAIIGELEKRVSTRLNQSQG